MFIGSLQQQQPISADLVRKSDGRAVLQHWSLATIRHQLLGQLADLQEDLRVASLAMRGSRPFHPYLASLGVAFALWGAHGQGFSQPKTETYMPDLSDFAQALALPQYVLLFLAAADPNSQELVLSSGVRAQSDYRVSLT